MWQGVRVHVRTTFPRLAAPLAVVSVLLAVLLAGCGTIPPDDPVTAPPGGSSGGGNGGPSDALPGGECEYVKTGKPAKKVTLPPSTGVAKTGTLAFVMKTNEGKVTITMDRAQAPCTINSFASLVRQHFYDHTACHRLADKGSYLLQCGDPTGTGKGGPGYTIPDELTGNEVYTAGTVAMARGDNPNTAGSQFFIVYRDSDLPPDYTIFGHVNSAGLTVINTIAADGEDGSYADGSGRPKNPAKIISIVQQ